MKFQAISGLEMGGVVRGRLGLGDESPEQECGLGLTHWKGLSAFLLSLPRPPCHLAQPLQEQGNTVLGTLLYQLLGLLRTLAPPTPSLVPINRAKA